MSTIAKIAAKYIEEADASPNYFELITIRNVLYDLQKSGHINNDVVFHIEYDDEAIPELISVNLETEMIVPELDNKHMTIFTSIDSFEWFNSENETEFINELKEVCFRLNTLTDKINTLYN